MEWTRSGQAKKKESSDLERGFARNGFVAAKRRPSPADTDDTILQFGEQCIRDVCAAEAEMNTPFARVL